MKRFLTAAVLLAFTASAHAADVNVPPAAFDWSGAYIGGFGAYSFGTAHGEASTGATDSFSIDGFQGGVLGGYNLQLNNIVLGAEADVGYNDIDGEGFGGAIDDFDVNPTVHVRARAGLPLGQIMPFIAAGLSVGDGDARIAGLGAPSHWHFGWNAGAGLDAALTQKILVRAEYIYDSLGAKTYNYAPGDIDFDWSASTVRMAVILKF